MPRAELKKRAAHAEELNNWIVNDPPLDGLVSADQCAFLSEAARSLSHEVCFDVTENSSRSNRSSAHVWTFVCEIVASTLFRRSLDCVFPEPSLLQSGIVSSRDLELHKDCSNCTHDGVY